MKAIRKDSYIHYGYEKLNREKDITLYEYINDLKQQHFSAHKIERCNIEYRP